MIVRCFFCLNLMAPELNRDAWVCRRCGHEVPGMRVVRERSRELAVFRRWWRIYFVSPVSLFSHRGPA